MKNRFFLLSLAALVTACGQSSSDTPAGAATEPRAVESAVVNPSVYEDAVTRPGRLDGDADRDTSRKPAEVLAFIGVQPGDAVLELFAGGGYYTELLSRVVGADGSVVAHMNTPLVNFAADEFPARHADNRLTNVEILMAENNALVLDADRFDVATIVLNYHDLYWSSEKYGWEAVDVPTFLAELFKSIRPGGTLGVVDHYAEPGSPSETGGTLHRIDPAIVIADLEAAGFVLDGQSDALRNADDDHSRSVFDPEIRGKTDRFILRFTKPE